MGAESHSLKEIKSFKLFKKCFYIISIYPPETHLCHLTVRRYNLVGVTRRKHRVESWYFSQKAVTAQGGYGVVFAVRVQVLWPIRVSRYKADREQVTSQGKYNIFAGTGAVAVQVITNLSRE